MTLEREPPSSIWKTASLSPPSLWPSQSTPRSNMYIPPSKESPAAIVWAADNTDVPEEAGRLESRLTFVAEKGVTAAGDAPATGFGAAWAPRARASVMAEMIVVCMVNECFDSLRRFFGFVMVEEIDKEGQRREIESEFAEPRVCNESNELRNE